MSTLLGNIAILLLSLSLVVSGASLNVWIYSPQGKPVDGVAVTIQSADGSAKAVDTNAKNGDSSAKTFESQRLATNSQGGVSFVVPAGSYTICAQAFGKNFLNPCDWDLTESLIVVKPGDDKILKKITLLDAIPFRVRLHDPGKLLARGQSKSKIATADAPQVSFGLWDSTGHYHPIPEVSGDDDGSNLELLVPINADLKLSSNALGVEISTQSETKAGSVSVKARPVDLDQPVLYEVGAAVKK